MGQPIFIQPKRGQNPSSPGYVVIQQVASLWSISQKYGIKLNKLARKNKIKPQAILKPGTRIELYFPLFGGVFDT